MRNVKSRTANIFIESIANSLKLNIIREVGSRLLDGYDLHRRMNIPYGEPIPERNAARQLFTDLTKANCLPHLATLLVEIHYKGIMGERYPISNLDTIARELQNYGFIFDNKSRHFIENPEARVTPNWGILREGHDYLFSFLRYDIIENSRMVREHPSGMVEKTFEEIREIITSSIMKRNGRVWSMEGDGGIIAFYFSDKNLMATLSAMEIIHRLFVYNRLNNRLSEPVQLRMAIHNGLIEYTEKAEAIKKTETIQKIVEIEEKYSQPNSVTISETVSITLDHLLLREFSPFAVDHHKKYHNYQIRWAE